MQIQDWSQDHYKGNPNLGKVARIVIRRDGTQEVIFQEDATSLLGIAKHPAFVGGTLLHLGAAQVATNSHGELVSMLEKSAVFFRPENGFDSIVSTAKLVIQHGNVQNVIVSVSAGAVTYPFWLWAFKRLGLERFGWSPTTFAICASTALAALVLVLLTMFGGPAVTADQCKKGYLSYQGKLSEKQFMDACAKLEK